jgi:parallel beta-helix repeat protein
MLTLVLNVQPVKAGGTVGIKVGDWIKCTYMISGWPSGTPYPEWLKVEFLSVEGTNATIRVTMRMSDGTEPNQTITVDVAAGGGTFQGLSGFVILANCTTGDSIYMAGYGNVTIAGETTGTYAGATRTVVYASFSQYGTQLTYYWDKLTGVMVEASVVSGGVTGTAKATETNMWQTEIIYIRADGSIDPPTAPIQRDGSVYTFTDNISSDADGVVIERDNMTLDGAGCTVQGTGASGSKGIDLSGRSNVTIKNVIIRYFWEGIILEYCSNNIISENNVTNNSFGIYLSESSNNSLSGNNITANNDGVILEFSFNNVLRNNNMFNNKYDFGVYGYDLSQFVNDVDVSNTVDGKPIYYWVNEADKAVPMDAGCVVLVNSTRITVRNLNLTKNTQGIRLAFTTNSTIAENSIANNDDGIRLEYSSNNSVSGNNITNHVDGIYLFESSNNSLSGNNVTENIRYGIMLYGYSNNNSIRGNNVANSFDGIYLDGSNNSVTENNITANIRCGIRLYYSPSNNSISGNHIANNQYGIGLEGSSGNMFYHNNFINNINQVSSSDSVNVWDDGYPSGGNYWSDYNGTDLYSGPYQNETGSDGIGDTPYVIDANNADRYPFRPYVPVLGDLNQDGIVNVLDAIQAASAFGSYPGQAKWNEQADINRDGVVNILDVIVLANNFGKH